MLSELSAIVFLLLLVAAGVNAWKGRGLRRQMAEDAAEIEESKREAAELYERRTGRRRETTSVTEIPVLK